MKNWCTTLTKGSCAIFLDLAKAFVSVNHKILLRKLECYGVRGLALKLFESYLSNRSQYVKVNGVKSILKSILYGVPQGSILGPLLFLIFINDLPEATSLYIKLFADDTFLCAQNSCFTKLESEVNAELSKVASWFLSNKLTLNVSKSKFMIIFKKLNSISVKIRTDSLAQCSSYKYLGIFIDKDLSWNTHIQHVTKKVLKACGAMAKLRHSFCIDTLKNVYYSLVYSYIRYGFFIWGNSPPSSLSSLHTALHKVLRIMTFAPYGNILKSHLWILTNFELGSNFFIRIGQIPLQIKQKSFSTFSHWELLQDWSSCQSPLLRPSQ